MGNVPGFDLVLSAAGINEQRKAAKAQRKSIDAQRRMAEAQNAQARREQVRKTRAARATVLAEADAMGAATSSVAAGATGSISSQYGANLSFLNTQGRLNEYSAQQQQRSVDASTRASIFSGLGSTARSYVSPESIFK